MAQTRPISLRLGGLVAALLTVGVIVAGCGTSSSSSSAAANSASSATPAAATSVSVGKSSGSDGTYLTGASGRALYLWVADKRSKSSCSGACASVWPPLLTKDSPVASNGVTASDLGTTTRSDGSKQVTYMGHPLYYYTADSSAGKVTGQGSDSFGAKWWLVAPSGSAITNSSATGRSSGY